MPKPVKKKPSNLVCNGHVGAISDTVRCAMINKIALHMQAIHEIAGIEPDHNTQETPERWAKMFINDMLGGRFIDPPVITSFDNARDYDQMIVEGPIDFNSWCAHHMLPFVGQAYIGLLPSEDGAIIGLSKYVRIVDFLAHRFQLQEDLTAQIADWIEDNLKPNGVGVQIIAEHHCMICRGVRRKALTLTTVVRGVFSEAEVKQEFLSAIANVKNHR